MKIITDQERRSKLNYDRNNIYNRLDTNRLQDTWFLELAHILFEKVDSARLQEAFRPVTFVSFNYDRCVEWFIYNALRGLYSLEATEAQSIVQQLTVLHPYGCVGVPQWLPNGSVDFGAEMRGRLGEAANRIRTFTEKMSESPELTRIRKAIAEAEVIIFLGYGFHPQNMKLLKGERTSEQSPKNIRNVLRNVRTRQENC